MITFNRAKYDFYYIVRVLETEENLKYGIANLEGTIVGITADEDLEENDLVSYSISFKEIKYSYCLFEHELEWTGKIDDPDKFKPEGSVQITPYGTLAELNSEDKS